MSDIQKKSEKAHAAFIHLMKKMDLEKGKDFMMAGVVMNFMESASELLAESKSQGLDTITENFQQTLDEITNERDTLAERLENANATIKKARTKVKQQANRISELETKLEAKLDEEFDKTLDLDSVSIDEEDVIIEDFEVDI